MPIFSNLSDMYFYNMLLNPLMSLMGPSSGQQGFILNNRLQLFNFSPFGVGDAFVTSSAKSNTRVSGGSGTALGNKIVSMARSFIGKKESDGSADIFWKGIGINWRAKDKPWCAAFVAYCLKKCGVDISNLGGAGWVPNYMHWKGKKYITGSNASVENIKPGDLVIFRGGAHIGIVSKVYADGTYDTIEGNHGNKVAECKGNGKSGHYKIKSTTGFVKIT